LIIGKKNLWQNMWQISDTAAAKKNGKTFWVLKNLSKAN
jgi:hypothetical protein